MNHARSLSATTPASAILTMPTRPPKSAMAPRGPLRVCLYASVRPVFFLANIGQLPSGYLHEA
jgi:hypothetical protein